ncbi:hypothetical protein LTR94_027662, partial [Friedmanniomyces endolithicus]
MHNHWFLGAATAALMTTAAPATAQVANVDIPAQPAAEAVATLARQAHVQILVSDTVAQGRRAQPVRGRMTVTQALDRMLAGSGLVARAAGTPRNTVMNSSPAQRISSCSPHAWRSVVAIARSTLSPTPSPNSSLIR